MPIFIIVAGIIALLVMIMALRINAFLALIIVSIGVGLSLGMEAMQVVTTLQKGVGNTLNFLAPILGLGAMLGSLIAESGAAQSITGRLTRWFGSRNIQWAMLLTGFIVGIPLFYTVGFLMLIPIIFAVTDSTKQPLLFVGIPMIAALSVTHGFLPPHPAPSSIAVIYGANIPLTLLYGLALAIPTVIIAGPLFGRTLRNIKVEPRRDLFKTAAIAPEDLPSFGVSVFTCLIPVILMAMAAVSALLLPATAPLAKFLTFIGDPVISLLISVLVATFTLGVARGKSLGKVMEGLGDSVKAIAMIMLIIAGGGAFKEILTASGAGEYIVSTLKDSSMSPLVLAWCIAAALRIALGSATVAALTAAGIAAPLVGQTGVSPELLVLATGAGSLTFSQVNDTGFWLFKEYFNLSILQTFKSWTIMETIVSLVGLAGVLLLDMWI